MNGEPPVNPHDAPYSVDVIPTGWDRHMTPEEADAANALYPVPPYGNTYTPPGPVPPVALARFVKVAGITNGQTTRGFVRAEDAQYLHEGLIFVVWPVAGVLGIVDDVGARPVRVMSIQDDEVEFNFDSTGLDTTGLVLLGVVYVGP